jgi:hypothetical protein
MKKSLKERIESHILYSENCWLTDLFCRDGIPMIFVKGRRMSVPRLYYQMTFNVKLEWEQLVLHNCGNKGCVKPEHMVIKKFSEHFHGKGREKVLNPDQVEQIKKLLLEGNLTQRQIAKDFQVSTSVISLIKHNKY